MHLKIFNSTINFERKISTLKYYIYHKFYLKKHLRQVNNQKSINLKPFNILFFHKRFFI